MALAYVAIAIVAAAYAGKSIKSPYVDGDLFWQKHLGQYVLAHHALPSALGNETFSAPGAPWTPQEWLLGIVDAIAVQHDAMWMLGIAAALALALAMTLSALRARRAGASGHAITICTVLLALAVEGSYGIRAQVFAWPLFVALLLLLDLPGAAIFFILPLGIVWANLHASVVFAVPVVWLDMLATAYKRGLRDAETMRRVLLSLLIPFVTLATPLGIKLPQYAFMLVGSPIRRYIDEWQPVGPGHHFFWYGAFPMLILVMLCGRTLARERPRDVALAVMLAAMSWQSVRNVALLAFVLMPLASSALDVLFGRFSFWNRELLSSPGPRRLAVWGGAAIAALVFIVGIRGAPGAATWRPANDAFTKLTALGDDRVFCYDFAVCSPALDYPALRVYMDGRADPYPEKVWLDFDVMRKAKLGWQGVVRWYDVDAVYVKKNDALDKAVSKERGWRQVTIAEKCCRLYVRPPSPAWW